MTPPTPHPSACSRANGSAINGLMCLLPAWLQYRDTSHAVLPSPYGLRGSVLHHLEKSWVHP